MLRSDTSLVPYRHSAGAHLSTTRSKEIRALKVTKINWPLEKERSLHLLLNKKKKDRGFFTFFFFFKFHLIAGLQHFKKKYFHISVILSLQLCTSEVSLQLLKYVSVTTMLCKSRKGGMLWQTCKYPGSVYQTLS